jgi:hypothetical protein
MIQRRALIQSALGAMALRPGRPAAAQAPFGDTDLERMRALAEAVLPQSIGAEGRRRALDQFMTWVRDYRADADGDHGYGETRVRRLPPSPALKYPAQLDDLDRRAGGAFATRSLADRQTVVTEAIAAANIRDFPGRPNGGHIATDVMAHYFNGPGANDLAYGRAISRGACRDLDGSDQRPSPLTGGR